jgi:hypothetical protein
MFTCGDALLLGSIVEKVSSASCANDSFVRVESVLEATCGTNDGGVGKSMS